MAKLLPDRSPVMLFKTKETLSNLFGLTPYWTVCDVNVGKGSVGNGVANREQHATGRFLQTMSAHQWASAFARNGIAMCFFYCGKLDTLPNLSPNPRKS